MIRATNRQPASAAATGSSILSLEKYDSAVIASEMIKSTLLTEVTGGAGLRSFFPGKWRFFAPGTGWPQT